MWIILKYRTVFGVISVQSMGLKKQQSRTCFLWSWDVAGETAPVNLCGSENYESGRIWPNKREKSHPIQSKSEVWRRNVRAESLDKSYIGWIKGATYTSYPTYVTGCTRHRQNKNRNKHAERCWSSPGHMPMTFSLFFCSPKPIGLVNGGIPIQ